MTTIVYLAKILIVSPKHITLETMSTPVNQELKLISIASNHPVPQGGHFKEVRTYRTAEGTIRTKVISVSGFVGRHSDWETFVGDWPFDDEEMVG